MKIAHPKIKKCEYDSRVWGPPFWFFIHTIAMNYPDRANDVTKRKYYEFVQNLPLFIPNVEMGNRFSRLLDKYPVTPYLDKRESFIRWTVFIHNKINKIIGKPEMDLEDAIEKYNIAYVPQPLQLYGETNIQKNIVYLYGAIILAILLIAYIVYY
jgi:FAD-linked sulfhydryl oxidase